jgi:hypothetical protein
VARVEIVEKYDASDAKSGRRCLGLGRPALSKPFVGDQDAITNISGIATSGKNQDNPVASLCGPSQRARIEKSLIVGMGMKGDQRPGWHLFILTGQR